MFSKKNLINCDNSFRKFINSCLDENIISIDTEFVRNDTFYPKLCLLQIGTSKGSYAIDPNKISNLQLLKKILRNKNILKIFHYFCQKLYHLICFYFFAHNLSKTFLFQNHFYLNVQN